MMHINNAPAQNKANSAQKRNQPAWLRRDWRGGDDEEEGACAQPQRQHLVNDTWHGGSGPPALDIKEIFVIV